MSPRNPTPNAGWDSTHVGFHFVLPNLLLILELIEVPFVKNHLIRHSSLGMGLARMSTAREGGLEDDIVVIPIAPALQIFKAEGIVS